MNLMSNLLIMYIYIMKAMPPTTLQNLTIEVIYFDIECMYLCKYIALYCYSCGLTV